jgi:hypothetical protein
MEAMIMSKFYLVKHPSKKEQKEAHAKTNTLGRAILAHIEKRRGADVLSIINAVKPYKDGRRKVYPKTEEVVEALGKLAKAGLIEERGVKSFFAGGGKHATK